MKNILILLILLFFISSCSVSPAIPESGRAFLVSVKETSDYNNDLDSNLKEGSSCYYNILRLVSFGDSSINAAKNNGGIKDVKSVNREILGIGFPVPLSKSCTIIKGM